MRDPRRRIQPPVLDRFDNAREIAATVAAGEQCGFAAMKIGVVERDLAWQQPDEYDAPAVGEVLKARLHRFAIARGVENHVG